MNYAAIYHRLMVRARMRFMEGYREKHHVIPRCMGGSGGRANIVDLTPEEHYVAHQLLAKIYPNKPGLALAAHRMSLQCTNRKGFGWLKRRWALSITGKPMPQDVREKLLATKRSPEARALAAEKQRGRKYSAESRLKMSISAKNRKRAPRTPEHQARITAALKGKKRSPETRARMAALAQARKELQRCL